MAALNGSGKARLRLWLLAVGGVVEVGQVRVTSKVTGVSKMSGMTIVDRQVEIDRMTKEYEKTMDQMSGSQVLLPAVGKAVIDELLAGIAQLRMEMEGMRAKIESSISGVVYSQKAFDFYYECQIDDSEMPF